MNQIKNRFILCLAFVSILWISCSRRNESLTYEKFEKISVDLETIKTTNLSNFCSDIEYIRLETNPNSFIANIDKIIINNNKFYILDKIGKKLSVFDKQGNHLINIGAIGKGPGQYINPTDFIIDKINGQVEVFDITLGKNITYSKEGQLINEKIIPYKFIFYEKFHNNYILQTRKIDNIINGNLDHFDVLMMNRDNSIFMKYFEYDPSIKVNGGAVDLPKIFTWNKSSLYMTKLFIDTVFEISKPDFKLHPAFVFDYGHYKLSKDYRNLKFDKAMKLINEPGKHAFGHMIYGISDSLICFSYGFNAPIFEKRFLGLYFRNNKMCYSFEKVYNDIDERTFSMPMLSISDTLVSVLYANISLHEIKNKDGGIFSTWHENDNPILMLMKIKKPQNNH